MGIDKAARKAKEEKVKQILLMAAALVGMVFLASSDGGYALADGGYRDVETVHSSGWVREFTSPALDRTGNAPISYYDGLDVHVHSANDLSLNPTDETTIEASVNPSSSVWTKEKPITVSGSSSDLADYQVSVVIDYESEMQPDYDDLRFVDENGSSLSYWIESYTASSAKTWVKVPSIASSGTTIYMHYGNPTASSASNGSETFEFFDDFSGTSLDSERWPIQAGSITVAGGEVHLDSPGTNYAYANSSPQEYNTGVIEFRAKYTYDADITRFGSFLGCGHYGGTYLGRGIHIWHAGAYILGSNDPGVYHNYKIVKAPSEAQWYFDDVYKFTRPISGNIGAMDMGCQEVDRAGDAWFDYVLVRKIGPVGGIAELPDISDSSGRNYIALAGIAAAALVALSASVWYARRRLS
jgi:hypothetical protein